MHSCGEAQLLFKLKKVVVGIFELQIVTDSDVWGGGGSAKVTKSDKRGGGGFKPRFFEGRHL